MKSTLIIVNKNSVKQTFLQLDLPKEIINENENEIEYLLAKTFVDGENNIYKKTGN